MKSVRDLMGDQWYRLLEGTLKGPEVLNLGAKLLQAQSVMTPSWDSVFKAYFLTPPEKLKVLILGQDPYPTPGQAMGLSFSSGNNMLPYSLQNIFKDLQLCDYDQRMRKRVDLTDWGEQGVLLLNTCLTTEINKPFAHKGWGWEYLVRKTLQIINNLPQPFVVFAWGNPSQEIVSQTIVENYDHLVLTAAHPAHERYSRGSFIGSKHFLKANNFLSNHGLAPIKWI